MPHQIGKSIPWPGSNCLCICGVCGRSWPQSPVPWCVAPSALRPSTAGTWRPFRRVVHRRFEQTAKERNQLKSCTFRSLRMRFAYCKLQEHLSIRTLHQHNLIGATVLIEEEYVSRSVENGEEFEVPRELLDKNQEARAMGLDADEYFPWRISRMMLRPKWHYLNPKPHQCGIPF